MDYIGAFSPGTPMCQEPGGLALVRSKFLRSPSQTSAMAERHLLAEGLTAQVRELRTPPWGHAGTSQSLCSPWNRAQEPSPSSVLFWLVTEDTSAWMGFWCHLFCGATLVSKIGPSPGL